MLHSNSIFVSSRKAQTLTIHDDVEWDFKLRGTKATVDTVSVVCDLNTMNSYKNKK
jgi:hypothetical protein